MTVRRRGILAAVAALLALATTACGDDDSDRPQADARPALDSITFGTKNFTEQYILGEIYTQALRRAGFRVTLKRDIGSSEIIDQALTAGSIDVYPEYIGVLLSEIAGQRDRPDNAQAAYREAQAFEQRRGFRLLAMTPFSDSNALAVKPEFARDNRVRSIGDLKRAGRVTIGAPPEFRTRFEGLVGLREVYGLDSVRVEPMRIGQQYEALDRREVEVAAVFTTDGQLDAGSYRVLRDPRGLFAAQNVAPVMNERLVREHGERLVKAIDRVSERLTTRAMREMNAAVDLRGEEPRAVAARFLRAR